MQNRSLLIKPREALGVVAVKCKASREQPPLAVLADLELRTPLPNSQHQNGPRGLADLPGASVPKA